MYDKMVQIALLFDFYGQLLTEKQIEIVDMHYNDDLSLSEISEQFGISRQGVNDTLKRAEKTLFDYEEKLGLVNRFIEQKESFKNINHKLDEILNDSNIDIDDVRLKIRAVKEYVSGLL